MYGIQVYDGLLSVKGKEVEFETIEAASDFYDKFIEGDLSGTRDNSKVVNIHDYHLSKYKANQTGM
ncbi:hypothetical protein [Paenibacillus glucanolyticus]|uniref:hypothetical protein n=1 Tax=Paenibacillus glucanolyticus TaxID=59843 RepID=UPI00096F48F9|nr:hypothetical protein [Paenibacillus glucanolyticus]OMF76690.1 hypothetical protein BK142_14305 [Paenibacillus glucanolyticus]